MSKAFTKDDATDEPVFLRRRQPLPAGVPNYVTPAGLRQLRQELLDLGAEAPRPSSSGSSDDQPASRPDLQALAARRAQLEQRIATAVLSPSPADPGEIRFGARVGIRGSGSTRSIQIVGVDEADPSRGLVAFVAPLARALLGRRAGDLVTVRTPGGEDEIEILAVEYLPPPLPPDAP